MTDLPPLEVAKILRLALSEDLGPAGDVTTGAVVPPGVLARAKLVARAGGRCAGLAPALQAFHLLDHEVKTLPRVADGDVVESGQPLAVVEGPAAAILSAERTALNLLGHLSGIATATAAFVDAVTGYPAAIAATRKTTPGLRALEKYAVVCGGGIPHRFGLSDGVLIKDNHIALAGGVEPAVERARRSVHHLLKVQVEVDDLAQLSAALTAGADAVLLDNMTPQQLAEAVELVAGSCLTEASGGVTLSTVGQIAASLVDVNSIGWITHSAPALDVALDLDPGN